MESDRHWVLVVQESVTLRIAVICAVLDIREIEILNDTNTITPPLWKEVIVVLYSLAFTIFRSCFSKIVPHVLLPLLLNFVNREHNYEKRTSGWLKAYSEKSFRPWIKILEEFYATVLTKDGADYKLDGFYVMVTAVDWYLIEKEYKRLIILEEVVKIWNEFLTKKLDIFACILLLVIAWLSHFNRLQFSLALIRLTFEKFRRAYLSQIALIIMLLPIKILLIQLIPSSVGFSEFRKAVFHDTTLYVSLHVCKRHI